MIISKVLLIYLYQSVAESYKSIRLLIESSNSCLWLKDVNHNF